MANKTADYRLRYIVPFAYKYKKSNVYEYACKKMKESRYWINDELDEDSDCYKYLREQYVLKKNGRINKNGIGSIWKYHRGENTNKRQPILHIKYEAGNESMVAGIVDAGIHLLKNGVGLFWYETEFKNKKEKLSEVPLDTLINFQYGFKELASRSNGKHKLSYCDRMEVKLELVEQCEEYDTVESDYICKDKGKKYRIPQSVIAQIVPIKDIEKVDLKRLPHHDASIFHLQYDIETNKPLGIWINEMLEVLKCNIVYYPEVKSKSRKCMMPDKALLFQYVVADMSNDEREKLAYCLTNGYKPSYKVDEMAKGNMQRPFENITWYAEKEGCGIYASYQEDNKTFLIENMQKRAMQDYFFLYMNLLQQSYVLLNVSEEIASTISADKEEYIAGRRKNGKLLDAIQMRIDVFLVKNMHVSVSHIGHHNTFYEYVEAQLKIRSDIASMRDGLEALEEIHRRQEDSKMTIGLSVLSVFAILSAFSDASAFMDIIRGIDESRGDKQIIFGCVSVVSVLVLFVLRDSLIKLFTITWNEFKHIFRKIFRR